jgi:hypothetical protein
MSLITANPIGVAVKSTLNPVSLTNLIAELVEGCAIKPPIILLIVIGAEPLINEITPHTFDNEFGILNV